VQRGSAATQTRGLKHDFRVQNLEPKDLDRRAVDVVVLDPPRAGAGRDVVAAIVARRP
jgi:tRNA/tmRNA/rRNA uracil-C5-methylase (TrmA/RlmC/RlmD family)